MRVKANARIAVGLAVLGVAAAAYALRPVNVLVVHDRTTGRDIFAHRMAEHEEFTLRYVHSVEKIPVTGVFTVDEDQRVILLETYFPWTGIGLPHEARPDPESGQLVLSGINEPREISFFSLSINDYTLTVGGCQVRLSPPRRDGHVLAIHARRRSRIGWLLDRRKEVPECLGPP